MGQGQNEEKVWETAKLLADWFIGQLEQEGVSPRTLAEWVTNMLEQPPGPSRWVTFRDRGKFHRIPVPLEFWDEFVEICNRYGYTHSYLAKLSLILGGAIVVRLQEWGAFEETTWHRLRELERRSPMAMHSRWTAKLDQFEEARLAWALSDDLLGQVEETLHLVRTIDGIADPRERRIAIGLFLMRAEDERRLKGWIDALPGLAGVTDRAMVEEIVGTVERWRREKRASTRSA